LVGDWIEIGAERGLHSEAPGEKPVHAVGHPGRDENAERDVEAVVGDGEQEERERGESDESDEVWKSPGTLQRLLHSFSRAPCGIAEGTKTVCPLPRMSLRSSNCLSIRVTVSRVAPIELAISWCVGRLTTKNPSTGAFPDSSASRSR